MSQAWSSARSATWIVLSSALLLGLRLAVGARLVRRIDPTKVVMWQMMLALPVFAAGALLLEEIAWDRVGAAPDRGGCSSQGIVVAGLGFTVSFHLMKRYTPSVIMSFNFASPIAGVVFAAWLLGDSNRSTAPRRNGAGCGGHLPRHAPAPGNRLTSPA